MSQTFKQFCFILYFSLFCLSENAISQTELLVDLNPGPGWSEFNTVFEKGDLTFFTTVGATGKELWQTDGTAEGTIIVKDIHSGLMGSDPDHFIQMGSIWFFTANDGSNGIELWKTNGTTTGTQLVKDINPGANSSVPAEFTVVGDLLFFTASNGQNGVELWVSNGTTTGTQLVKDIQSGNESSFPKYLSPLGQSLIFAADDGQNGQELWVSDGTSAGTQLVKDVNDGSTGSFPTEITEAGELVFFSANDGANGIELWQSDGTAEGTTLVKNIAPGIASSSPKEINAIGDKLFFTADNGTNGLEFYWVNASDPNPTPVMEDIHVGKDSSFPSGFLVFNEELYFNANNGPNGFELWKSDGTVGGTFIVKDVFIGFTSSAPINFIASNERLYFYANDGTHGFELWETDGTTVGTKLVKDINPVSAGGDNNSFPKRPYLVGETLYFTAFNELKSWQIWKTTGDEKGAVLVTDIPNTAVFDGLYIPFFVKAIEDTILFVTFTQETGEEYWSYKPVKLAIANVETNSPLLCFKDANGSIEVTMDGGIGPKDLFTYQWNNPDLSGPQLTGLSAGVYEVTVTDCGGQTISESIVMTEPSQVQLDFQGIMRPTCLEGDDGTAVAMASGGVGNFTYLWDTGETTNVAENLKKGMHTVTVTDANGCSLSANVLIPGLTPNAVQIKPIGCNGDSTGVAEVTVDGIAEGYTFLWDNNEITSVASMLSAGMHSVTIVDQFSCSTETTVMITEAPELQLNLQNSSSISCFGENDGVASPSVSGGSGPYQFDWSTGDTIVRLENLVPGNYILTLTDDNECVAIDSILLIEPDTFTIAVAQTGANCLSNEGGIATANLMGGIAPYTYQWDNQESTETASALTSGMHLITAFDANGCEVLDSVFIELNEALTATITTYNASDDVVISGVAKAEVSGGIPPYTYQWPDTTDLQIIEPDSVEITAGDFSLTVIDSVGCEITIPFTIDRIVNVENVKSLLAFEVSPNPSTDFTFVNVQLSEAKDWTLSLYDYSGRILRKWNEKGIKGKRYKVETNELESGMYFLQLQSEGGVNSRKLMVIK